MVKIYQEIVKCPQNRSTKDYPSIKDKIKQLENDLLEINYDLNKWTINSNSEKLLYHAVENIQLILSEKL